MVDWVTREFVFSAPLQRNQHMKSLKVDKIDKLHKDRFQINETKETKYKQAYDLNRTIEAYALGCPPIPCYSTVQKGLVWDPQV